MLASVEIDGVVYSLEPCVCAGCQGPVLIASRVGRRGASAIYDSVTVAAGKGVKGVRHRCRPAAPRQGRLSIDRFAGSGPYRGDGP